MNKVTVILGVAALASLTGCKDPTYARNDLRDQNQPANIDTTPAKPETVETTPAAPVETPVAEPVPVPVPDPVNPPAAEAKPAEPEYTVYIVQRGDYLAKISKKYNITIKSIKELNKMTKDDVRLGQKLKLPGKVDVGEQKVPEGAIAKPQPKEKKEYKPYAGATEDYVVKSGDMLSKIAYGRKISTRQLKELNGLTSDKLRIGQKLKVPAAGETVAKAPVVAPEPAVQAPVDEKPAAPAPVDEKPAVAPDVTATPVPAAPEPALIDYVVKEGEDVAGLSVAFQVSSSRIRELNGLSETDVLKPGQVIKLPADAQ